VKREIVGLVSEVGLTLLGGAVVLIILTALLFMFPTLDLFGAKAVKERNTQIVYQDSILDDAFANGKFIIESTSAQIEVQMSNEGYNGEGTISIDQESTGVAFNSLNRTLIEWTQTLYNDELYYRIKVLEPSGIIFNDEPTTVYINLPHRDPSDSFMHDFVLQAGYSNVNFSFADKTAGQTDALKIGNLVVESAASVNVPSNPNISLNNIKLESQSTKFNCQSSVLGDVLVTGSRGEQTFNTAIDGAVTISGNYNKFSGDTAGDVIFKADNGSLNFNKTQSLEVETVNGQINIDQVVNGVVMNTEHGNLSVGTIHKKGLNFKAGTKDNTNATASVSVESVKGDVIVNNYGVGKISLKDVNGDVEINSYQKSAKEISVAFSEKAEACKVKILGYDGDINVKNINGLADIQVHNWENGAGAANVYAHFKKVVGEDNVIKTGGYTSGHQDWGNVDIVLNELTCNNFKLFIYGASSANSHEKYGFEKNNMYINGENNGELSNLVKVKPLNLSSSGAVHIYTKQSVFLS